MVLYVVSGILLVGCLAAIFLMLGEIRDLVKIKKYTKTEAVITRKVNESWSGDSADREGGEYEFPVVEFYVESHGTLAFVLRQPEHYKYAIGEKITIAYLAENPTQAIVVDSRKAMRRLLGHIVVCLILFGVILLLWYW